MKKQLFLFSMLCLFVQGRFADVVLGQEPAGPPKILLIEREEIKPGKVSMHERLANGYAQAFAKAKLQGQWIGMTPVTGNENEAIFTEGYDSFEALEKTRHDEEKITTGASKQEFDQLDRQGAEVHTTQRIVVAVYRPDLSYKPNIVLAQARYLQISVVRMRPGRDFQLPEIVRILNSASEKANMDQHTAVFQAVSGAPGGTYFICTPVKSLKELDAAMAGQSAALKALGEENGKKVLQFLSEGVISNESSIYEFNPRMSYVTKEFASADPDFWNPKPKQAAQPAPAAKKENPKAEAKQ